MDVPSRVHYNEVITGLASSGVQAILVFSNYAYPGHPLVPTLMVSRLVTSHQDQLSSSYVYAKISPQFKSLHILPCVIEC